MTLSTPKRLLGYFRRYLITATSIWVRQRGGWVELRRDEIAALKFETVSRIIVRYYNGRRFIVSLYGFSNPSYDVVCRSLRDAMRHNEQTRGLWDGAKVFKYYDGRKTRVAAITALVLAALGTVLWIELRASQLEPVYQGKTLAYCLSDFWPGRNPTHEKIQQDRLAARQIGTNAIPVLLQWISTKDGPFKAKMVMWIDRHRWVPFRLESSVDKNMLAVSGFSILGKTQVGFAIPALVEIVRNGRGERTSGYNNVTFPMWALADLDREAAAKVGIQFGTNGALVGWNPSPTVTNK